MHPQKHMIIPFRYRGQVQAEGLFLFFSASIAQAIVAPAFREADRFTAVCVTAFHVFRFPFRGCSRIRGALRSRTEHDGFAIRLPHQRDVHQAYCALTVGLEPTLSGSGNRRIVPSTM